MHLECHATLFKGFFSYRQQIILSLELVEKSVDAMNLLHIRILSLTAAKVWQPVDLLFETVTEVTLLPSQSAHVKPSLTLPLPAANLLTRITPISNTKVVYHTFLRTFTS